MNVSSLQQAITLGWGLVAEGLGMVGKGLEVGKGMEVRVVMGKEVMGTVVTGKVGVVKVGAGKEREVEVTAGWGWAVGD